LPWRTGGRVSENWRVIAFGSPNRWGRFVSGKSETGVVVIFEAVLMLALVEIQQQAVTTSTITYGDIKSKKARNTT
jgi:hypothetical protein